MFAYEGAWNGFHWWWLIPIAMMVFCFLRVRGRRGCVTDRSRYSNASESAREILEKRYALGEISKEEYEEKKRGMSQ
jgi:putative membrane protein